MNAPFDHVEAEREASLAAYRDFLRGKIVMAESAGFEIDPREINPNLKDFVREAIVPWAASGGRRAIFSSFGLHKTSVQLELARLAMKNTGVAALQIVPLGVRQEFFEEAALRFTGDHAVRLNFIRRMSEVDEGAINLTNYETAREGHIDARKFGFVSLDEAACLRGFGGTKTFREFMAMFAGDDRKNGVKSEGVRFRYVATATPDPNEFIELLAYAAFLGIMDVGQAKTRFFKRDSEHADKLTIHPHKEREFWLWVASWALFVRRPSDLGFSDDGYDMPALDVRWHEVPSDHRAAGEERDGQVRMFKNAAFGVSDAAHEKRDSLPARIAKMQEIRAEDPRAHRIIWHDLEAEREGIEENVPVAEYRDWCEFRDGNPHALALYERHYSAYQYADGRERNLFCGPGYKLVLLTRDNCALFAWRKFIDGSGQQGINCAVFRNEGPIVSSELIKEAMAIAWMRWPGERFYTYVDPDEIASDNPGYCFKKAGWRYCGTTQGGLHILEALPGVDVPQIERREVLKSIFGSQALETNERTALDFKHGRIQELATKPSMSGAGCNFQAHCHHAVFLGIGHKFHDFIQAVHRLQRFGQQHAVRLDLIYSEAERETRRNLEAKWKRHEDQAEIMSAIIREYGLSQAALASTLQRSFGVARAETAGENYRLINNDCVEEAHALETGSVHLIVTSIPFSTQYEYTPSYNDFGHTDDDAHFWAQMDFLTPQLLRALQPGRDAAIHVKDRIVPGGINGYGFQSVSPFSDQCVAHFMRHGFVYLGRIIIITDVVRENNQTYRLGWTEQCKDGSRMGPGMPEYLLLFRKPPSDASNGYADVPVRKDKREWKRDHWTNDGYSRGRWQLDAHGFHRSSGNRLLTGEELIGLPADVIYKTFRKFSAEQVYDFERHVAIAETLESKGSLPPTFMLLPPASWHPDVWSDVTRMRTLNGAQHAKGREMHLCPLQFDIVDRAIAQFTMPGETVLDPFGGLMTVPYRALLMKRRGIGIELSTAYWRDGAAYCDAAERQMAMPSLFDFEMSAAEPAHAEAAE